jgi:hypothetical protein
VKNTGVVLVESYFTGHPVMGPKFHSDSSRLVYKQPMVAQVDT